MAMKNLYQYFKRDRQSLLPGNISLLTIDAVNKEVKIIASVQSDNVSKMRGKYIRLTAKDRATIGEYTAKNGIAAAINQNNVQVHEMTRGTWPTVVPTFFTSTA